MEPHINDITRVIQVAVAPVFLLTAVATLISALNVRLGRNIDRRRSVQERVHTLSVDQLKDTEVELRQLGRRAKLIYFAILAAAVSALMVCLVVAGAFLGVLLSVDLAASVAGFFVLAMLALIVSLWMLLREVFLAVKPGFRS